jgi:hypothetical protein
VIEKAQPRSGSHFHPKRDAAQGRAMPIRSDHCCTLQPRHVPRSCAQNDNRKRRPDLIHLRLRSTAGPEGRALWPRGRRPEVGSRLISFPLRGLMVLYSESILCGNTGGGCEGGWWLVMGAGLAESGGRGSFCTITGNRGDTRSHCTNGFAGREVSCRRVCSLGLAPERRGPRRPGGMSIGATNRRVRFR